MNKFDMDTTVANINVLLSKKGTSVADGTGIISGKINTITDKKELDLVSGALESWGQVWGNVWFAIG